MFRQKQCIWAAEFELICLRVFKMPIQQNFATTQLYKKVTSTQLTTPQLATTSVADPDHFCPDPDPNFQIG
jgi:hypothetical protein